MKSQQAYKGCFTTTGVWQMAKTRRMKISVLLIVTKKPSIVFLFTIPATKNDGTQIESSWI
jgi:hypothetical protein